MLHFGKWTNVTNLCQNDVIGLQFSTLMQCTFLCLYYVDIEELLQYYCLVIVLQY